MDSFKKTKNKAVIIIFIITMLAEFFIFNFRHWESIFL